MSKVSIKEEDKTLFAKKRVPRDVKPSSEGETSSKKQQGWQRGQCGRG